MRPPRYGVLVTGVAGLFTLVVLLPFLGSFRRPQPMLDAPLDASLRVPVTAYLLGRAPLQPGDELIGVVDPSSGRVASPRDRRSLDRLLENTSPGTPVELRVKRRSQIVSTHVLYRQVTPLQRISSFWPLVLLGLVYVLFGLAIGWGSRHPVARPVFVTTLVSGTVILGTLDLVLPRAASQLGVFELRGRGAAVALMLLPAALLHLAMRFPVVFRAFQRPGMVAVPYLVWLLPAGFAQLRFQDAALRQPLDLIALGAAMLVSALLISTALSAWSNLTPIERSRSRALAFGLGLSWFGLMALSLAEARLSVAVLRLLPLAALAFPAAAGWAIVRYRLLDPPLWLRELLLSGLTATAALVAVSLALSTGLGAVEGLTSGVMLMMLGALAAYQLVRTGFDRVTRSRALAPQAYERLLTEASDRLSGARNPDDVLGITMELCGRHLGAAAVSVTNPDESLAGDGLAQRGIALWREHLSPEHGAVSARSRAEDPRPDRAELVASLTPARGGTRLLVLSARRDALPYAAEQLRMIESLAHVATAALGSAATSAELERRVAEKTASIRRSLRDGSRVLEAARGICEAELAAEVFDRVEEFARASGLKSRWALSLPQLSDRQVAAAISQRSGTRVLVAEARRPGRFQELGPQLETVCVFAGLAVARLELLAELKREVDRQSREIAEITSHRLHAEFVRGVAHELRKPNEEVYELAVQLANRLESDDSQVDRILATSAEMSRRLDLLLFHSGVRLDRRRIDLVQVVEDAVSRVTRLTHDREFEVHHAQSQLPLIADPTRLASVVENLVDNAVKATEAGASIRVSSKFDSERCQESGPRVVLEVEDNGVGIEPEDVVRVFDPGVALLPGGFGLGLALCREIVRLHGGSIEMEPLSVGCRVRVRLPRFAESD